MKTLKILLSGVLAAAALTLLSAQATGQTLTPTKLADYVKGPTGVGDIELIGTSTGTMTAATLEAFRQDNSGKLVFAVDVNENASGTEKASSQAVAVFDAWLDVVIGGVTSTYGHVGNFYTQTQATIYGVQACQGASPACTPGSMPSTRSTYYTLLGDSGSSRVTAGKIGNQAFDSTLAIKVPLSLAGATSAKLHVRLVDTGTKSTDPEAFYDFTGGFEDMAIVTQAFARQIDVDLFNALIEPTTTFRVEAPAIQLSPEGTLTQTTSNPPPLSWLQMPGANSYYIAAYEDLIPNKGDYDFNDAVVAYQYQLGINASGQVERMDGVAYLIARGSTYTHDWTLDIPLPAGATLVTSNCSTVNQQKAVVAAGCAIAVNTSKLQWLAFKDTVTIFPGSTNAGASPINTPAGTTPVTGPKATFSVSFTSPVTLSTIGAADPWLYVRNTSKTIRLSDRDASGLPFAMLMPSDWKMPNEYVDMGNAYTRFVTYINSNKTSATDWYLQPNVSLVQPWSVLDWAW